MAYVVTDDTHYKNIAAALKTYEQVGDYKPEAMAGAVHSVCASERNVGFNIGREETEAEYDAKYFVGMFVGDGTGIAKLHVPFNPDCITVYGTSPLNYKRANAVAFFTADLKTFGYICGINCAHRSTGSIMSQAISTKSIPIFFQQDADGFVTLSGFVGDGAVGKGIFPADIDYVVVAARYTELTDKQYLNNYVGSLGASGGQVTLSKERVESVYPNASANTNEEWNTLISTKSNWQISLL